MLKMDGIGPQACAEALMSEVETQVLILISNLDKLDIQATAGN